MTQHTVHDPERGPLSVLIRRDRRLKKSARWLRGPGGEIVLRVPYHTPQAEVARMVSRIEQQIVRQAAKHRRRAERSTDAELQARAEYINGTFFGGAIRWTAIRWVGNMTARLGSCTTGGPTDGHIRISDKICAWPQWVIDYVIAHELAHRVHPHHGPEFWAYLQAAYPLTERARGFIQGVGFAQGAVLDEDEA